MATSKGTCGACFRLSSLGSNGLLVRHGWTEAGGTRRVGSYGHVFHSGACFGAGWKPYEVSPDCTKAFLATILFPMGVRTQEILAYLATRPDHVYEDRTSASYFPELHNTYRIRPSWERSSEDWDGNLRWSVRLRSGDAASKYDPMGKFSYPSYEAHHGKIVFTAKANWEGIAKDALYCYEMIMTWKTAEVKAVAKKVPVVHLRSPHVTYSPWCRQSRYGNNGGYHLTDQKSEVTCAKCAKIIAAQEARA